MTEDIDRASEILATQLRSIPIRSEALSVTTSLTGKTIITVPLNDTLLSRVLRRVFPIREKKKFELDTVSATLFAMFDGKHTVAFLIDAHMNRWHLSFFEARGMILDFLRRMAKHGAVALIVPEE